MGLVGHGSCFVFFGGLFYNEATLLLSTSCWNYAVEKFVVSVLFFLIFLLAIANLPASICTLKIKSLRLFPLEEPTTPYNCSGIGSFQNNIINK